MTISIVIPVCNVEEATDRCIQNLLTMAAKRPEIIIIDNASNVPYANKNCTVIRNEKNAGYWPSMLQGINAAKHNIVMTMHNDVLIWQQRYDEIITAYFDMDDDLAIAGLFGGSGVGLDGGRGNPMGNMLGKEWGMNIRDHGHLMTTAHPAVVFDSLTMIFDRTKLVQVEYRNIPPHHWTDRLITLRLIKAGFHALCIGIAFDHGGSFTAVGSTTLNTFTEDWCKAYGLELDQTWDYTLYKYGEAIFKQEFLEITKGAGELWVNQQYEYQRVTR